MHIQAISLGKPPKSGRYREHSAQTVRRRRAAAEGAVIGALALLMAAPLVRAFTPAIPIDSPVMGEATAPFGADENDRIGNYIPVLTVTENLLVSDSNSPDELRAAAADWVKQTAVGKLKPLLPDAAEHPIFDGPKGEIFVAVNRLSARLHTLGSDETSYGDPWQGAQDEVLSAMILRSIRYSDYTTESYFSYHTRGVLEAIRNLAPQLTASQKKSLRVKVASLSTDANEFALMANMERNVEVLQKAHCKAMEQAIVGMPDADKVSIDRPQPSAPRQKTASRIEAMVAADVVDTLRAL